MFKSDKITLVPIEQIHSFTPFRYKKRWWNMGLSKNVIYSLDNKDEPVKIGFLEKEDIGKKVAILKDKSKEKDKDG